MNPLDELYLILLKQDHKDRLRSFEEWKDKHVQLISVDQYVINRNKISSTDHDDIVTFLTAKVVEEMLSKKGLSLDVTDKRYTLSGIFLKLNQKPFKI